MTPQELQEIAKDALAVVGAAALSGFVAWLFCQLTGTLDEIDEEQLDREAKAEQGYREEDPIGEPQTHYYELQDAETGQVAPPDDPAEEWRFRIIDLEPEDPRKVH